MGKNSQSGFNLVIILLVLVLLGVIGYAGWMVYDNNKSDKTVSKPASSSNKDEQPAAAQQLEH